ncbi:hypothetical protein GCM10017673_28700 [Streptosporangium violaceochromogenes]|nr:hypothetical protein GCM10017673_28700 [Streptosporangium violaceochromogenes]
MRLSLFSMEAMRAGAGTGSRRLSAIAAWPAPGPTTVFAPTAEELRERMDDAEAALLLTTPSFSPVPGGGGPSPSRRVVPAGLPATVPRRTARFGVVARGP